MDKANIIISIIIVLCIAAAVAAYGITNSDNPIFSDLSSMGANDDGNGLGNNTTLNNGTNLSTSIANGGDSGSSGSGSSSSSSNSGSSSVSHSSSSKSGSSSSGSSSSSSSKTKLSYSTAKSIVNDAILEDGCYAGSGYYSGGYWYFTVYDASGNAVDSIAVNDATGQTERA